MEGKNRSNFVQDFFLYFFAVTILLLPIALFVTVTTAPSANICQLIYLYHVCSLFYIRFCISGFFAPQTEYLCTTSTSPGHIKLSHSHSVTLCLSIPHSPFCLSLSLLFASLPLYFSFCHSANLSLCLSLRVLSALSFTFSSKLSISLLCLSSRRSIAVSAAISFTFGASLSVYRSLSCLSSAIFSRSSFRTKALIRAHEFLTSSPTFL